MKHIKFVLLITMFIITRQVSGQYIVPLYAPGNSGGLSSGSNEFTLSVIGQNVIGVSENIGNKVYFGVLLPLTLTTNISQPKLQNVSLGQNYPNPFHRETTIPFEMERKATVLLRVTNISGQPIDILLDQELPPGKHLVQFDASRLSPGIFFYQLELEGNVLVKSMVLTK